MTNSGCFDESCDQPEGHSGPHGYSPQPGLVFAPYGGGESGVLPSFPSGLLCIYCHHGSEMTAREYVNGGGQLVCSCGQQIAIDRDGSMSAVWFTLWPSGMKESSPQFRKYIIWRCQQQDFYNRALLLFKLIDEDELQRRLAETREAFDGWERAHPVQPPLLRRILRAIGL